MAARSAVGSLGARRSDIRPKTFGSKKEPLFGKSCQHMIIFKETVPRVHHAIHVRERCACSNGMECQTAPTIPGMKLGIGGPGSISTGWTASNTQKGMVIAKTGRKI